LFTSNFYGLCDRWAIFGRCRRSGFIKVQAGSPSGFRVNK
jgi:hypothetical protein